MKKFLGLMFVLLAPLSAYADVTFYGQCNYKGPGVTLDAGEYSATALKNVGIPEDAIASVKVSEGVTVTLFEHDGFKGRYGTLQSSDMCLEDDGFSNIVSSLTIKAAQSAFGTKPSEPFGKLNSKLTPRNIASATDGVVTVYADCNYKGVSAKLTVGDYNLAQLKKFGLANNEISSARVPKGMSLMVYENDFLRGAVGTATGDIACLDSGSFGGKVSSVSVVSSGGAAASSSSAAQPASQATAAAAVYADCSYGGRSANLPVGEYTSAKLAELGIANNSISAIKLAEGYQIELFLNDFFRGQNGMLGKNNPCLVGDYSESISSVKVSKKSAGTAFAAPVATVYLHCNFKGASQTLAAGKHSGQQLEAARISDNTVSSIKLSKGYQATIYDGSGFNGKSVVIKGDDECLDDNDMNEKMSSIVIEPIGTAGGNASSGNFVAKSAPSNSNDANPLIAGLTCVQDYVEKGLCDEKRWTVMDRRCGLSKVPELSDGYLQGHVKAGNCNAELWNELVRRTANPQLR